MTVEQLISKLRNYPKDMEVVICEDYGDCYIYDFEVRREDGKVILIEISA